MLSTSVNRHSAKSGMSGETLLDANKRAAHSEFYSMGGMAITPDNTIMALAEDFLSRRQYGIRFRNLKQVTGTRKCWITLNPALSGQMTLDFSTMSQASGDAAALWHGLFPSRHRYASKRKIHCSRKVSIDCSNL